MDAKVAATALWFAGTRGNSDLRSDLHRWHSCLLVECQGFRLLLDCGQDWLGRLGELQPDAILITHAHPDHAWGLRDGAPCPVYATGITWQNLDGLLKAHLQRNVVPMSEPFAVGPFACRAFALEHATVAPAVGYRLTAAGQNLFYCPDVAYIHERGSALAGVGLYIGDGASVRRSLVRRRGSALIGHAAITAQLTWCQKEGVPWAIFTHCGNEVIADHEAAQATVRAQAAARGLRALIAHDGLCLDLPAGQEEPDHEGLPG